MNLMHVMIKPLTEKYQNEAKRLILSRTEERFGFIDHTLNPDLNDICSYYSLNKQIQINTAVQKLRTNAYFSVSEIE